MDSGYQMSKENPLFLRHWEQSFYFYLFQLVSQSVCLFGIGGWIGDWGLGIRIGECDWGLDCELGLELGIGIGIQE